MQTASEIRFQLPPLPGERGSRHRRLFQALHPPLPRIARLLALAIHLDGMMARQDLDCRQIARRGHISRTRVTQILNLVHLAPDIQERLLFLTSPDKGRVVVTEKKIRSLASEYNWERQRFAFERLFGPDASPPSR